MAATLVRAARFLGLVLAAALVLLALLAAGLWWWAGTQGSLDWALRQAAKSQPLQAQGAQGSLRSGVKATHLQWERDGLKIEAFDAELAWQPLALANGLLRIDHLRAARLRIEDRRAKGPRRAPAPLVLPVRVDVQRMEVAQVQWVTASRAIEASELAGSYAFDGASHRARVERVRWGTGTFSGEGTLGAREPLPVDARLQGRFEADVPAGGERVPITFTASLAGPIADLQARAQLQGASDSALAATSGTATARITPWADQPVPQADAEFRQLDAAALWPQAPRTALTGRAQVQPAGTGSWTITIDVTNAAPGPWDQRRLPVEQFNGSIEWRSGAALVRELRARLARGEVRADGQWNGARGWAVQARLARVDPASLHTALASLPISGTAQLQGQEQIVDFDVDLKGDGEPRANGRGNGLRAAAAALELRSLKAKGRWAEGLLSLPSLEVLMSDAALHAQLQLRPREPSGSGRAQLDAPGLQAQAEGTLSERAGGGTLRLTANDLARATQWLARWPGVSDTLGQPLAGGRAEAQLAWQGGWRDPNIQASASAPVVTLRGAEPAWTVRDAVANLQGRLGDAQLSLRGRLEQERRQVSLDLAARGGRGRSQAASSWQGQVTVLDLSASDAARGTGTWGLALRRPFDWRWAAGRFDAGAGEAALRAPRGDAQAVLSWEPLQWRPGELHTAGRLAGLPMAWIQFLGGPQLATSAVSGDMVFDAQWDADLGERPRIRASLVRTRGDVTVLAETAEGAAMRVPAGVREARLALESSGEAVTATLRWDSERGGTASGRVATRLEAGGAAGWQWPPGAPLSGSLQAQLPRIGVWSLLAPPGWRLRGSLAANVNVSGTRADPTLSGTIAADDLALRSVVNGIELQGGRLRARLDGDRVLVDEFLLRGPGADGGTVVARGEASWTDAGFQAGMTAQVDRLRASIRSDRQLTVSGNVAARRDASGTLVSGKLKVDQALIVLPDQATPRLGDDVLVRGPGGSVLIAQGRERETQAAVAQQLQLDVEVDLGTEFRVRGMGVDTRLRGRVDVAGQSFTSPRLNGTIRASGGQYEAYGQRLEIERGVLRFNGPADNPALDVLAIRPNMTQRVGVHITGTALLPFVRLYSEPEMADAEKLAWLVTGRASPATGAESALVQQAALALLAGRTGAGKRGVAASLGLDELSFRREGAQGEGPAITLGKRLGRDFYAAYERSLSGALGTLFIFYDVSRKLTLRAQAGERTALDLIYTLAFD